MRKLLTSLSLCVLAAGLSSRAAIGQTPESNSPSATQNSNSVPDSERAPPQPESIQDTDDIATSENQDRDGDADQASQERQRQQEQQQSDRQDRQRAQNGQAPHDDSLDDNLRSEADRQRDGQDDRRDDERRDREEGSQSRERNDQGRNGRQGQGDRRPQIQSAADLNVEFNSVNNGLQLTQINQTSVLANSGLQQGDVLVSVQGRNIRNEADFIRWYRTFPAGARVPLIVLRGGRQQTIYLTNNWGYGRDYGQDYDRGYGRDFDRGYENRPNYGGAYLGVVFDDRYADQAVVEVVRRNTAADQAGLRPGDTIQAINGQRVRGQQHATQLIANMQPGEEIDIVYARRARTSARLGSRSEGSQVSYDDYDREANDSRGYRNADSQEDSDYSESRDGRYEGRDGEYDRSGIGDNGPMRRALPRPFRNE